MVVEPPEDSRGDGAVSSAMTSLMTLVSMGLTRGVPCWRGVVEVEPGVRGVVEAEVEVEGELD